MTIKIISAKKLLTRTKCLEKKKKRRADNTPFYQRRFEGTNQFDLSEKQNRDQ